MTTPPGNTPPGSNPYGSQPPGQPYPGQPYPGQPYPGQPYGAAYGQGPMGPGGPVRPGVVTAAAVLAFVSGGFAIIGSLIGLAAGSFLGAVSSSCSEIQDELGLCESVSSAGGTLIVLSIVYVIVSAVLIWGGVQALSGKNSKILVIVSALSILVALIQLIATAAGFMGIFGMVIPILIIVFLLNANAKAWFQAKGGQTF